MTPKSFIIAVDGPAAAGKGTLARRLADHYRFAFLDSGSLYRGVALLVLRQGIDPYQESLVVDIAGQLSPETLQDPEIRSETTSQTASKVAAIQAVRSVLLNWQRQFAAHPPGSLKGAVLDGRDIGTVVCPDAQAKLFVTASPEARAKRRFKELQDRGEGAIYARVLQDMVERDARDRARKAAPLKAAEDAFVIDTSDLTVDQVFERAKAFIDHKMKV